jgi:hypothetical protein
MNTDSSDSLEWIDAENTLLKDICRIEQFHWGQRYFFNEGPDHGKYNFIRLLDNKINKSEFREILATQGKYFQERAKTLHIKIPSSVFKEPPAYLNGLIPTGLR